jgi:hypothetical protein
VALEAGVLLRLRRERAGDGQYACASHLRQAIPCHVHLVSPTCDTAFARRFRMQPIQKQDLKNPAATQ